jgi:GxxExxY protein
LTRALGPGLLESTYEACLAAELGELGLGVERQVAVPVVYKGVRLDVGYRMDMLVERLVVVELKVVARLEPVHTSQVLSYLRLAGKPVGLLINFNVPALKHGIRRIVWGRDAPRLSVTSVSSPPSVSSFSEASASDEVDSTD